MTAEIILDVLQTLLCPKLEWLREKAKESDPTIDDELVNLLELLLCGRG